MMALDPLNNLDEWPLRNFDKFIVLCGERCVSEVNLTGSNTDPLMYKHHASLTAALKEQIPNCKLGLRTNGAMAESHPEIWSLYDKASISITSFDADIYKATMGCGAPPNISALLKLKPEMPVKVNVVLCPEVMGEDIKRTLDILTDAGIKTVNLREPYGQPHLGSPLKNPTGSRLGMPRYDWKGMDVTYWDVHYVEVESVNLYANGIVSETYPITKGHAPNGEVIAQQNWTRSGRQRPQWLKYDKELTA
jgi:hypothetical protein